MVEPGSKATILVADDDEHVRALIAGSLRDAGYTVVEAATGEDALACSVVPDLLIADLVMPPAGGLELADRLRSRIPALAVIHISGYGADSGFNDDATAVLLSKPFTMNELQAHVEWALGRRASLLRRPAR